MKFLSCEHDSAVGSMHFVCRACRDAAIAALGAQLADAIAGREADAAEYRRRAAMAEERLAEMTAGATVAMAAWGGQIKTSAALALERNAQRAEVARLRAAIEPTADNVRAYEMAGFAGDITPQDLEIQARIYARNAGKVEDVLAAIRARAGEVSAPGCSLREGVEEALIELQHDEIQAAEREDINLARGIAHAIRNVRAALGEP